VLTGRTPSHRKWQLRNAIDLVLVGNGNPGSFVLDLMLDQLEDEVLDRCLASSMHAPNPEECHPSYAYLSALGSKGESRTIAASLHSPYRSFPSPAYVRNGEVHYLANVFPELTRK